MRLLLIGDIVGKPGRKYLKKYLADFRAEHNIDLVIANAENAAGGAGLTEKSFKEVQQAGVDLLTGGNHIWDQKDIFNFIDNEQTLIRPANYPPGTTPGRGFVVVETKGQKLKVAVLNLLGRVFMEQVDCPFRIADEVINQLREKVEIIIVDFHAEATSEKQAMGWYLNGRVSAVVGTHSHVQTADQRILSGKTAYITDVGMVGLYDAILGVDKDGPINRFLTRLPCKLNVSDAGKTVFNAVLINLNERSGTADSIDRIFAVD
ncbi:MAG: TIGR00282 family metallophosphoesterase [Bacillota bacterium]